MKDEPNERRAFLTAAGALLAAGAVSRAAAQTDTPAGTPAVVQKCMAFNKKWQGLVTPESALAMLREGNKRFVTGNNIYCDLREQVKETADQQAPYAAILGCIDSRVPPELIFDLHLGDIFAARVAGNFVNTDILGSMEYATKVAGAKLIVVLGHSHCGAIKGAVDNTQLGNLTAMLANIRPEVLKVKNIEGPQDSTNEHLVQAVAEQNARDAAEMLSARSEVLRGLVGEGKLKIVPAMHDVGTGAINWFD
jgi:carbonic anhydrase